MLPILFPFLADTVMPPEDFTMIRVHEWGVVTFSSSGTTATGAPEDTYGFDPFGMVLVDAPVVWFHGAPFTGTFTARAEMGFISAAYPEPRGKPQDAAPIAAVWRIEGRMPRPFEKVPSPVVPENTPFAWAMEHWRDVPCLDLYGDDGGYLDRFLYYETAIPDGFHARMNTVVENGIQLAGFFSPEGLILETGPEPAVNEFRIVPLPGREENARLPLERDGVLAKLCGWAGGNLKSQEIEALWNTWEPFFMERPRGERWLLFPLPPATVGQISTISLIPESPGVGDVEYHRLFLGLVRLE